MFEYYRLTISYVCGGNFAQTVHHYEVEDPTGTNQFVRAKDLVETFISAGKLDDVCTILAEDDSFISSIHAARSKPASGANFWMGFAPSEHPGTFVGATEASQVAGCAIWLPGTADKKFGRTFFPGVSEDAMSNGVFVDDYKTAFSGLVSSLLDPIMGTTGEYNLALKTGVSPGTYFTIEYGYLSPTPGTQRRRLMPV